VNLGRLHGYGSSLVIIHHMIDPRAHRIATHEPGIEGLQQFGRRSHILHSRIEPIESRVVAIRIEND
jgi:hypothetical protein